VSQEKSFPLLLLVDDDPVLRKALQEIFEFSQYAVVTAGNGKQGLEMLRSMFQPPDLIISDMVMPDMDGFQFMQAVQAEEAWHAIPFIFLSGRPKSTLDAKELRQVRYVPKPFLVEDLLSEVSSVLNL
jgi:CheY-like chemotaxis protein